MTIFKAAAVQMRTGIDVKANVDDAERMIRAAAGAGADYVLTPEMTTILDKDRTRLLAAIAPQEDDPSLARFRALARELGIHLHIGSMAIRLGPDGVANRSFLIGPDGGIIATYDKIHLFDATLPGLREYRESATYAGGDIAVVSEAAGVKLGMTICYDVRFPALHRQLAVAGAELISVPAAFTVPTGEAHWEVLLRARAIETGCFVVAAAQAGHHQNGRFTYGHSMIVDPWGNILRELGGDGPGVLVADIDLKAVAEARGRVPALANGREFSLSVNPAGAS
jgi:predicted amidohydrolase